MGTIWQQVDGHGGDGGPRPPARGRVRRGPASSDRRARLGRGRVVVLSCGLALAWNLGGGREAVAGGLCRDFMLACHWGDTGQSVQLRKIQTDAATRRKVQRNLRACDLVPNTEDPFDCDWRATVRAGASPAARTAEQRYVSPAAAPLGADRSAPPSQPAALPGGDLPPPPAPAPPRRDPGGRLGATPAPTQPRPAVHVPDRGPWSEFIDDAAKRYHLPPDLIRAVMQVESGYNPQAESFKGAVGLMQLLPETGRAMGAEDLRDPAQNIAAGARFLRLLANRFGGDLVKVLSAYHAGSARVLQRDATPFAATDSYVRKVLGVYYALRDG